MTGRLDITLGTQWGVCEQGMQPDFVLVFIGQTVAYLTTESSDEPAPEYDDESKSIDASVAALRELGVCFEVRAVATRVFGIGYETTLPVMSVVGDGIISLIGWQSRGCRLAPIF